MADRPKWVLANTVVPSTSLIEKNLASKISRRLERGIVRWKPPWGSSSFKSQSSTLSCSCQALTAERTSWITFSKYLSRGTARSHPTSHRSSLVCRPPDIYTTLHNTQHLFYPVSVNVGKDIDNQYLPCPLAKEIKTIHQRGDGMTRRRPATSTSSRWRKCLHLRGKK